MFVLEKKNKDTTGALQAIAKALRLKKLKVFGMSGTKDKKAITTQRVTAYRIFPEGIKNNCSKLPNIRVGNFRLTNEELRFGMLAGNKFSIVIRGVEGSEEQVELAMNELKEKGYINYFGLQRFGGSSVHTHQVGIDILKKNWEGAVHKLLDPREGESFESKEARVYWKETGDIEGTIQRMPKYLHLELKLLRSLIEYGENDFLTALSSLPTFMKKMYVHSFQSYVWNFMTTARMELFGKEKPVAGDLIVEKEVKDDQDTDVYSAETKIKILEESDLSSYTIYDIVLPLPGMDSVYPKNRIGEMYQEMLDREGITKEMFVNNSHKDFQVRGGYRKLVGKPKHLTWKFFKYNDSSIPLIVSPIDLKNGAKEPSSVETGKFSALKVEFILTTASYATICLREIIKL